MNKECPPGKFLNTITNRCNKIKIKKNKICPPGKILNPKTNRCNVLKNKKNDIIINNKNKNMKKDIINNLKIIQEYEKILGNTFKANSYNKVIYNLELFSGDINSVNDIKDIKGIGDKIKEKINEFILTGKINKIETIQNDDKYILSKKISTIYGIGPAKSKELMNKLSNFDELFLPENKSLLNNKQQIGLKYQEDLEKRIPFKEGIKHYKIIENIINSISKDIEFEMVGSYRRKSPDMGDIDILIKDNNDFNLGKFIEKLKENNYIIETLANGKKKFMGISKINELPARRLDILVAEKSNYYFTLLYFTGSYTFNIEMRKKALEQGLSLSEYGFTDLKTKKLISSLDINSEEDIFKKLNMIYIKPENRI